MLCQQAMVLLSSWSVVCCVSRPCFCSYPGLLYVVSAAQVSALILVCCMLCQQAKSWSVACCVSRPSFCSHPDLLYVVSAGQILVCCMLCQQAKFLLSSWSVVCCISMPSFCSHPGLLYVTGVAFADSLLWKHRVQSWRHQTAEVCD